MRHLKMFIHKLILVLFIGIMLFSFGRCNKSRECTSSTDGDTQCMGGDTIVVCEYDSFTEVGSWETVSFCSSDEVCEESSSSASCVTISLTPDIRIIDFVAFPDNEEKIVLKNFGSSSVNISGWTLGDRNAPNAYVIPSNTVLSSSGSKTFFSSDFGFVIDNTEERIYLKNSYGTLVHYVYN